MTVTTVITKRLNGVDLHQPARGWSLQAASTIRPPVATRRSSLTLPRHHGERPTGRAPVFAAPTVRLEWLLTPPADTQASLEGAWADLLGLLGEPGLTYEHITDDVLTSAPAEVESISEPSDFTVATAMRCTALLVLPGVFLRGPAATSTPIPVGERTLPATWGSHTAPIADPILRFGPDVTDPSVTDTAWGEGITWRGRTPTGRHLFIDPAAWRAWTATSDSAWTGTGGTDVTPALTRPPAGRLQLRPRTTIAEDGKITRAARVRVAGGPVTIHARGAWL